MRNYRQELKIITETKQQFLNLSFDVEEIVRRSQINDGICVVCSQHSTSAVFLDNDSEELKKDYLRWLEKLTPQDTEYMVDYVPAGRQHLKQIMLGASVTVSIADGHLELGPRQYIMYGDFDGCREKTVIVKIIGE